jgi:hypothetical protein
MIRNSERRTAELNYPFNAPRERNGRVGGEKRRVGVKYCGGCNPHYDRLALAEDLRARLGGEIAWASPEARDLDLVLAIEGCQTACADLSPFEGSEIRIITCREDAEGFILEMVRA